MSNGNAAELAFRHSQRDVDLFRVLMARHVILRVSYVTDSAIGEQRRRLRCMPAELTWAFLTDRCQEWYNLDPRCVAATWEDDEEEEITMSSDRELRDAVDFALESEPDADSVSLRLAIVTGPAFGTIAVVGTAADDPAPGQPPPAAINDDADENHTAEIESANKLVRAFKRMLPFNRTSRLLSEMWARLKPEVRKRLAARKICKVYRRRLIMRKWYACMAAMVPAHQAVDKNGHAIQAGSVVAFSHPASRAVSVGSVERLLPYDLVTIEGPNSICDDVAAGNVEMITTANVISICHSLSQVENLVQLAAAAEQPCTAENVLVSAHKILCTAQFEGRAIDSRSSSQLQDMLTTARSMLASATGKRKRRAVDYTEGDTVTRIVDIKSRDDGKGLPTPDLIVALIRPVSGGPAVERRYVGWEGEAEFSTLNEADEALARYKHQYGLKFRVQEWRRVSHGA